MVSCRLLALFCWDLHEKRVREEKSILGGDGAISAEAKGSKERR